MDGWGEDRQGPHPPAQAGFLKDDEGERKKERKQTTQGRDGRTARRHHTGILRRDKLFFRGVTQRKKSAQVKRHGCIHARTCDPAADAAASRDQPALTTRQIEAPGIVSTAGQYRRSCFSAATRDSAGRKHGGSTSCLQQRSISFRAGESLARIPRRQLTKRWRAREGPETGRLVLQGGKGPGGCGAGRAATKGDQFHVRGRARTAPLLCEPDPVLLAQLPEEGTLAGVYEARVLPA